MNQSSSQFDWNATQYSKFLEERTRPAAELVARVPIANVSTAVDLGCGPGNSTSVIKARWPGADILGIDNSEEMLEQARSHHPNFKFTMADLTTWEPTGRYDLIFSNAALQWVGNHNTLLERLMSYLNPGGVLAIQMPHNHNEVTHASMREVANEGLWSVDLSTVRNTPPILEARDYYDILNKSASEIDIWETRYFHIMDSVTAIAEWLKGTGLRPFLAPLSETAKERFMERYIEKLESAFPVQADGKVLLPFPRMFIIAKK